MKLLIYTRPELIHSARDTNKAPDVSLAGAETPDATLLLEGSWPADLASGPYRSLDEQLDGRFDWIDQQAADWAELLGEADPFAAHPGSTISAAYLNARSLRYYLVKLIRPLAYLTSVEPLQGNDRLELIAAAAGRDKDYAELLSQLCRAAGVHYQVRWIEDERHAPDGFPPNPFWRRWAGRLSRSLQPPLDDRKSQRRVVLCGNPRLLDPVCRELLRRRGRLWWLYDRFAVGSWLRWQAVDARQLVCDSSLGRKNRLAENLPRRLQYRGVNLAVPIRHWLAERMATHGPRQTRMLEQIDAHFRRVQPDAVVLDEDATPLARAAVAIGRQHGATSFVVQHGVPYCRFGFAPPAADRILVWGQSSAQRLIDWGVSPRRIRITGSPQHDPGPDTLPFAPQIEVSPSRGARPPRILLLTTVPPRDDRPDSVALHLTGHTYSEMLRMAFATLAGIDGVELIVKLHPRVADDPTVRSQRAAFPLLNSRVVQEGPLEKWFSDVDCVLSCASSAGVEAASAGLPVIQLAPPGASGFLPHGPWGLAGTACDETELQRLLAKVLVEGCRRPSDVDPDVFAHAEGSAAARVADEILASDLGPREIEPEERQISIRVVA